MSRTMGHVLGMTFLVLASGTASARFISQPAYGQAISAGFENFAGIRQLRVQVVGANPSGLFPHFDDVRYE